MTGSSDSLDQLRCQLRAELPALVQEYQVKALGLFGSYVRQEQTPESDLDVLVEYDEPPSLFPFIRLESHLSELLGVKVDLLMKDALRPGIGQRILMAVEAV